MLCSFILSGIFWGLGFFVNFLMITGKIERRKQRVYLVRVYKFLVGCSKTLLVISMGIFSIDCYRYIYNLFFSFCMIVSKSLEFSQYIALSIILVTFQPVINIILKAVKKDLYKEIGQREMKEVATDIVNKAIICINKIPVKGVIHIINLFFVILANCFMIFDVDTNITTTSIYMSVATFYAFDKVVGYFAKKYSEFWKRIDNRLFDTEKIDANIKFGLSGLKKREAELFAYYIRTGKYRV